jgi:hypothetical protein
VRTLLHVAVALEVIVTAGIGVALIVGGVYRLLVPAESVSIK